jgi:hypothetical protein
MSKYRKKPVVIEATQFNTPPDFNVDIAGVLFHANCGDERAGCSLDGRYYVETLEGPLVVSNGDWIITGVKGEIYPCKPDIFDATYEKVED